MKEKKHISIQQLANLPQYSGLSKKELEDIRFRILYGDIDTNIDRVIESFEEDYDLSNMTANDKLALTELARIFVMLDKLQRRMSDPEDMEIVEFEKLNRITSMMRDDASKLQRDLNITRKARQDTGSQSVVDFIEDLKARAKVFLQDRLASIYCPKCKMLIAKVWFLYADEANEISLVCGREKCGKAFTVTSQDLKEGRNIQAGPPR